MNEPTPGDGIPPAVSPAGDDPVGRLERQLVRASLHADTVIGENALRVHDLEGFVFGVVDVLLEKALVTTTEIEQAVEKVKAEMTRAGEQATAQVAMRVDEGPAAESAYVPVNCEERMPICRAVCCKLRFALSREEIESGKVKWDLGQPYYIRQEDDGLCSHNNRRTGGCEIYFDRPRVCQGYSCAKDERIWTDFDNMVLNQEWLDSNLADTASGHTMVTFLGARISRRTATPGS